MRIEESVICILFDGWIVLTNVMMEAEGRVTNVMLEAEGRVTNVMMEAEGSLPSPFPAKMREENYSVAREPGSNSLFYHRKSN